MKRRDALKNIGLTTAFFTVTPPVISLLQSCTAETKTWIPDFFSKEEGIVLSNLVDVILPKTQELPSASELNIPQFIDKYANEVFDEDMQARYKSAFGNIIALLKPNASHTIEKVTPENYKILLDNHLMIKSDIDEERKANPESLALTKSELLNDIKWMTINAYKTSEYIGENVLAYDPIPGAYYCGYLNELTGGKSWSVYK